MTTIVELLGDQGERPHAPRPVLEAQVMELQKLYALYGKTHRFKPGNLVKLSSSMGGDLAAEPHIVLEVRENPSLDWSKATPGSSQHGARLDIRVLTLSDSSGTYAPVWLESWMFESYEPKEQTDEQS